MIALADHDARLALFAEGLAGSPLQLRSSGIFPGRRFALDAGAAAYARGVLYLPERLDAPDAGAYRLLIAEQLGYRNHGTLQFSLPRLMTELGELPAADEAEHWRHSDFGRFFHRAAYPGLLKALFNALERGRVLRRVLGELPGLIAALTRWQEHGPPPVTVSGRGGTLQALSLWAEDHPAADDALRRTGLPAELRNALDALTHSDADVHRAAALAWSLHQWLTPALAELVDLPAAAIGEELAEFEEAAEEALEWQQREARLDDWQRDVERLDVHSLEVETLLRDEADAAAADGLADGEVKPEELRLNKLREDRGRLQRRLDMERSAVRDALGSEAGALRSYRYDEWDHLARAYRPRWCRLLEYALDPDPEADLAALLDVVARHAGAVKKQFEQMRPLGLTRVDRLESGDELDLDALVRARQDARAGQTPDPRVYARRERRHRDVCAALIVDLSASTDDALEPPEPHPQSDDDPFWTDADPTPADPPRRIIEVLQESMLVMASALGRLGDSFGIYGFSGYGREGVEYYVAKEPEQRFTQGTLRAIAAMKPMRSTRMGPAIRHAVSKLQRSGRALRVLIVISDGFPQDTDYGPERGNHEYGLQDTARAFEEAEAKGIESFCITVDRSGHDYLRRMCAESRYLVIEEVDGLPGALSKVYQVLTG